MRYEPQPLRRGFAEHDVSHLGVLDWGIGGVDLLRRLQAALPTLRTSYVSDAGFTPYGKLDADALTERLERVLGFLVALGVDGVVIACNAASTAIDRLTSHPQLAVLGVITPTLATLLSMGTLDVAVLGGERTIASRAYEEPLIARGARVRAVVAQPLSALVEAGELSGPRLERAIARISAGLEGVDTLVPACTHYAALLPLLQRAIGPRRIVDPAAETTRYLRELVRPPAASGGVVEPGAHAVYTTGDVPQMQHGAARAFGVVLGKVTQLSL